MNYDKEATKAINTIIRGDFEGVPDEVVARLVERGQRVLDRRRNDREQKLIDAIPIRETCVHTEHCCYFCGCKYGEKDCPVTKGRKAQSFRCGSAYTCGWCYQDMESRW